MSQSWPIAPIADLLTGRAVSPGSTAWPPSEWVTTEFLALGMVQWSNRTGLQVVLANDGTVIIRRGEGPEARELANWFENHLSAAGYQLRYGGGPDDMVAAYAPSTTR
jgi:hypothetical protein